MTKILTVAYPTRHFLDWVKHNSDNYNILTQHPGETVIEIIVFDYEGNYFLAMSTAAHLPFATKTESPNEYNKRVLGITT